MIRDARVLDDEIVPDHELILHRREEMDALLRELRPREYGATRDHVFAFGPTGTGKSTLARLALSLLEDDGVEFDHSVVNCWEHPQSSDVLYTVCEGLFGSPINRHATSTSDLRKRLKEEPDRRRIVVLDECDQLAETDVLYDLHRAPEIAILYLGNDEEGLFSGMSERVQSRIDIGRRIDFSPYSVAELTEILNARANHALVDGAVSTQQLEAIASAADGNARRAIRSLRLAAEAATAGGRREVADEDIADAIPDAREELRQKSLSQLTAEQRLVYDIIHDAGPITPSDIYERYAEQVGDPKTDRTVRTWLSKMRHYNLVEKHNGRRDRTYTAIELC